MKGLAYNPHSFGGVAEWVSRGFEPHRAEPANG
jgi:hypothetical protein